MVLPDGLHHKSFVEWNYIVKGLMEVWELARELGMEEYLENALREDVVMAERLARIGNEFFLRTSHVPIVRTDPPRGAESGLPTLILGRPVIAMLKPDLSQIPDRVLVG
jgi:hypothetical protein